MNFKKLSAHQLTKKIVLTSFIYFFTFFFLMPQIVVPQGRVEVILFLLPIATIVKRHFTVAHYPVS